MLEYAYHHGVSVIALEKPEVIGYLRYYWVKNGERRHENYNWKVSIFRSSALSKIKQYGERGECILVSR